MSSEIKFQMAFLTAMSTKTPQYADAKSHQYSLAKNHPL